MLFHSVVRKYHHRDELFLPLPKASVIFFRRTGQHLNYDHAFKADDMTRLASLKALQRYGNKVREWVSEGRVNERRAKWANLKQKKGNKMSLTVSWLWGGGRHNVQPLCIRSHWEAATLNPACLEKSRCEPSVCFVFSYGQGRITTITISRMRKPDEVEHWNSFLQLPYACWGCFFITEGKRKRRVPNTTNSLTCWQCNFLSALLGAWWCHNSVFQLLSS